MIKIRIGLENLRKIDFRNPRTQVITLISLVGVLAVILYLHFIFIPQIARDIKLIGKTLKIKKDTRTAKSIIAEKPGFKKRLEEYNKKVELYEKKLPEQQEIPSLLENLSTMARSANITIVGITPSLPPSGGGRNQVYQEIPVVITAKSGYHELGRFINNLENGNRFMKVLDIDVKADKATPQRHNVEMVVCTYTLLPER